MLKRCASGLWSTVLLVSLADATIAGETNALAIVNTYGLHHVSRETVLDAAGIRVGDAVPDRQRITEIVRRLEQLPGVAEAAVEVVLTPPPRAAVGTPGQHAAYIGIREKGPEMPRWNAAPRSDVVLPAKIVETYREFERTKTESIRRGDFSEDDSHGYALLGDDAARAVQQRFVPLANDNLDRVIEVLRNSADARQRAMAAWVVGYADDKQRVATELALAARDEYEGVRNNALRALAVLLGYAEAHPELSLEVPLDWCFDLLDSVVWTDRNKAVFVLLKAPDSGDPAALARLRERALATLVEMARWDFEGHAVMSYLLLSRWAGLNEKDAIQAWSAGEREKVIEKAEQAIRAAAPAVH